MLGNYTFKMITPRLPGESMSWCGCVLISENFVTARVKVFNIVIQLEITGTGLCHSRINSARIIPWTHKYETWIVLHQLFTSWWFRDMGMHSLLYHSPNPYSTGSWNPFSLLWRHNERDGLSNHRRLDCLINRLFRCRSKKTSKLRVTGLCEGNTKGQ